MDISADDPGPERERFRRRILDELEAAADGLAFDHAERFKLITDL